MSLLDIIRKQTRSTTFPGTPPFVESPDDFYKRIHNPSVNDTTDVNYPDSPTISVGPRPSFPTTDAGKAPSVIQKPPSRIKSFLAGFLQNAGAGANQALAQGNVGWGGVGQALGAGAGGGAVFAADPQIVLKQRAEAQQAKDEATQTREYKQAQIQAATAEAQARAADLRDKPAQREAARKEKEQAETDRNFNSEVQAYLRQADKADPAAAKAMAADIEKRYPGKRVPFLEDVVTDRSGNKDYTITNSDGSQDVWRLPRNGQPYMVVQGGVKSNEEEVGKNEAQRKSLQVSMSQHQTNAEQIRANIKELETKLSGTPEEKQTAQTVEITDNEGKGTGNYRVKTGPDGQPLYTNQPNTENTRVRQALKEAKDKLDKEEEAWKNDNKELNGLPTIKPKGRSGRVVPNYNTNIEKYPWLKQ